MSRLAVVLCAALILVGVVAGDAQVPQMMSYQGVLRDPGGTVVPDDDYVVTFRLYDAESGGTLLWTEPQTLPVTDGILNATLGVVTTLDLEFDVPYWLGISVAGEAELVPRVELTAAPYALRALHADAAEDDDWVISGNLIYRLSGRVGIGTNAPAERLHVAGEAEIDSTLFVNTISSMPEPPMKETTEDVSLSAAGAPNGRKAGKRGKPAVATPSWDLGTRAASPLVLQTEGTTRVHIDGSTGNVGIGTETPDARLDVEGTVEAAGIRMPTGASDNLVLTSDGDGNASWELWSEGRVPNIVYADTFTDTILYPNAGAKIRAAIVSLAGTGGIIDARGLTGDQWIEEDLFESIDVEDALTILLGQGTYHITTAQYYDGARGTHGGLRIVGQGFGTEIVPETGMTIFKMTGESIHISDMYFNMNFTNSTAILFWNVTGWSSSIERLRIQYSSGTATLIKLGENWIGEGAQGAVVRDVSIYGSPTQDAIEVHAEEVVIEHTNIYNCRNGIKADGGSDLTIWNCQFEPVQHALLIDEGSYDTIVFSSNTCEDNYGGAIRVHQSDTNWPIKNLVVRDNYFTQMNGPDMDAITLKGVRGVLIEGNRFGGGFVGSGAESVVFLSDVTNVSMGGNITLGIEPTMPGFDTVAGLQVNDVTATQTSNSGGFGSDLTVGGVLSTKQMLSIQPRHIPPAGPSEGDIYMDASTHKLMVYDGSAWRACW